ncbi:MAG: TetR/AcrR family transcriptional regulator [Bacteroidales bacterium]|nr:TetR/AcrR family transcriptional regulator [Bacteroidales bacterium]MCF8390158.1 TetR/AcrR family transcriptional regulator [Bacteroidales bacterium]
MQTERQKEIISVALNLISEKGIQGLTIKNLSKEIGISEPAIYRHFESKIDILIAILEFFKKNTELIFKAELSNEANAIKKLEHLFLNHFATFSITPSMVSVIFSEEIFRNEPLLIEKISEVIATNDKILTSIILAGQNNSEIRSDIEAKNLSIIVMGSLRLFVKKWQFSNYSYNLLEEGTKFFDTVRLIIKK